MVEVERVVVADVDVDGDGTRAQHRRRRCREREVRDHHLVSRPDPERREREEESVRTGVEGDGVAAAAQRRELALEVRDPRPLKEAARAEDLLDPRHYRFAQRFELAVEGEVRDHAIAGAPVGRELRNSRYSSTPCSSE